MPISTNTVDHISQHSPSFGGVQKIRTHTVLWSSTNQHLISQPTISSVDRFLFFFSALKSIEINLLLLLRHLICLQFPCTTVSHTLSTRLTRPDRNESQTQKLTQEIFTRKKVLKVLIDDGVHTVSAEIPQK